VLLYFHKSLTLHITLKCGTPQQHFTDGMVDDGSEGEKEKDKDKEKGKDRFWLRFFRKAHRTTSGADPSAVAGNELLF
jgi:hypothetical protein